MKNSEESPANVFFIVFGSYREKRARLSSSTMSRSVWYLQRRRASAVSRCCRSTDSWRLLMMSLMCGTEVRRISCWKVASAAESEEADVINNMCMTVGSGTLVWARKKRNNSSCDTTHETGGTWTNWTSSPFTWCFLCDLMKGLFSPSLWVYERCCVLNTWVLLGGRQVCCRVRYALKYCCFLVYLSWSENSWSDKRSCQLIRNTPFFIGFTFTSQLNDLLTQISFVLHLPSIPSLPFLSLLHLSFSLVCLAS